MADLLKDIARLDASEAAANRAFDRDPALCYATMEKAGWTRFTREDWLAFVTDPVDRLGGNSGASYFAGMVHPIGRDRRTGSYRLIRSI